MIKCTPYLFLFLLVCLSGRAQEPEYFTLQDFQLQGPVKRAVVRANYGEETFEFDRKGRLRKTLTQYSEKDYDITYYKFEEGRLAERRDEVYRDGSFDPQTSMAHIYKVDTLAGLYSELVLSYDRSIAEQLDCYYNDSGQLVRQVRADAQGTDETLVTYETYKSETTATYTRNGNLVKTVRHSKREVNGEQREVELTKEFPEGAPGRAVETVRNSQGQLLRETRFRYDTISNSFTPEETLRYSYDAMGFPESLKLTPFTPDGKEKETRSTQYIYQMDGADTPNWVRQVTVPANTFVVRSIEYFGPPDGTQEADTLKNRQR